MAVVSTRRRPLWPDVGKCPHNCGRSWPATQSAIHRRSFVVGSSEGNILHLYPAGNGRHTALRLASRNRHPSGGGGRAGGCPAGPTPATTGMISAPPTANGVPNYSTTPTDAEPRTASNPLTIRVVPPPFSPPPTPPLDGLKGFALNYQLIA